MKTGHTSHKKVRPGFYNSTELNRLCDQVNTGALWPVFGIIQAHKVSNWRLRARSPATSSPAVVLRIARKLRLRPKSSINAVNGLAPANFVSFVLGKKLRLGKECNAEGTLYAAGLVKIDAGSTVNGQVFAADRRRHIGETVIGHTISNQIVIP